MYSGPDPPQVSITLSLLFTSLAVSLFIRLNGNISFASLTVSFSSHLTNPKSSITSLISHYSHLYTSEEAMDLVVHVFRGAVRDRRKQSRLELDFAKRRLAAVLTKNLKETRAMVWHAAQIIAMAREYFIHAPCETMRVFMGHIFILAYAKYGCPLSRGVEEQEHGRFPPVRLDQPTWREEQTPAIDRWIEKGGPASVGSVEDICDAACLGVLKEDALQMMRDMRIWGLGKKFCKVLDAFDT
jgi:hypothetical protein